LFRLHFDKLTILMQKKRRERYSRCHQHQIHVTQISGGDRDIQVVFAYNFFFINGPNGTIFGM